MNRHYQCVRRFESRIILRHFVEHTPYHIRRLLIFPSETEAYRRTTLNYFVVYCDPDHIFIAHILQHMVEQVVHAILKWLTGSGGRDVSEMIGGLWRTFHCVPRVLNLVYSLVCTSSISNVCSSDISHHSCVLNAPFGFLSACYVSNGGSEFSRFSLYKRAVSNRGIPLKFSTGRAFVIYTTNAIVNTQSNRGHCT